MAPDSVSRLLDDEAAVAAALPELRRELLRAELAAGGWDSPEAGIALLDRRRRAEQAEARSRFLLHQVAATAAGASGAERARLLDRLLDRREDAERRRDPQSIQFFEHVIAAIDPLALGERLERPGALTLESDPAGADVSIHRYELGGFELKPGAAVALGRTPFHAKELLRGSYLAILRCEGRRETRYPFVIESGRVWDGATRLYTEREIGPEMIYVPAGSFIMGGDDVARGISPRRIVELAGFFIQRVPVTIVEYLEFVDSGAASQDPRLVPRSQLGQQPWWKRAEDGRWNIAGTDPERFSAWRRFPSWPVMGIPHYAAEAWCRWAAEQRGRLLRLPREAEWEKAARGVDGRIYPWGDEWHPSLTSCRLSYRRHSPSEVGSFPGDESPYGVRDMAGNVDEWCDPDPGDAPAGDERPLRGGAWTGSVAYHRIASRDFRNASQPYGLNGFRYAIDAP